MDIREYLFRHKMKHRDLARRLGISDTSLSNYVHRHATPTLERALHIYKLTNGEVELEEMIALTKSGKPKHCYKKSRNFSMFPSKKPLKDKEDEL